MTQIPIPQRSYKASYKPTIDTFLSLLDEAFGDSIRLNEVSGVPETLADGKWRPWKDADDSALRLYFQAQYDLYHKPNLQDAFNIFLQQRRVNPVTDLLDSLVWDGTPRLEQCLHHLCGCEDTPYTREVSRLVFAGGVNRAYRPGCKFDDVAVLVGKQGGGKSALVRLLAMDDTLFKEVKTFEGKEGIEALQGGWIIEIPEMLATARAKEVELVKAYITRQEDVYRKPYTQHPVVNPRRCIFVGTTNNDTFLVDRTGNRRFYPVNCQVLGHAFFDKVEEHRAYIRQCWAEAVAVFRQGKLYPYATFDLLGDIREQQEMATEDDPRKGLIQMYCDRKAVGSFVCSLELWVEALQQDPVIKLPTRRDTMDINQIMRSLPGWEYVGTPRKTGSWGNQRGFRKAFDAVEKTPDMPF